MSARSGVYEIVNTVNGKRYIGSAYRVSKRWDTHKHQLRRGAHHSLALQRAWNKYGEEQFEFRLLLICGRDMCRFYEQRCLDSFAPAYNIALTASAPMAGRKHSDATRAAMSKAGKGKPKSQAHREAIGKGQLGNKRGPQPPEIVKRMSLAHMGILHTSETKAKIAAAQRNRPPVSEATRQKMSASAIARWYPNGRPA